MQGSSHSTMTTTPRGWTIGERAPARRPWRMRAVISCYAARRMIISVEDATNLGPLAALCGVWEGDNGSDLAPSATRGDATSHYRERTTFTPAGRVENHEQILYALKFATVAWRIGHDNPFHEELGIWLWDAAHEQVMRCFVVPRGITVLAGGRCTAGASRIAVAAKLGSSTFGICSNPFLDAEFKTVAYELALTIDGDVLSYQTDTVMQMKGRTDPFHHTDRNVLRRVAAT